MPSTLCQSRTRERLHSPGGLSFSCWPCGHDLVHCGSKASLNRSDRYYLAHNTRAQQGWLPQSQANCPNCLDTLAGAVPA